MHDITLRPLRADDFERLTGWLNEPHVASWWEGPFTFEAVTEKYMPRLEANSTTRVFVIEFMQQAIGIIQCYRHSDYPDWERAVGIENAAGIDYLIGELEFIGKGFGPRAIELITKIAFELYPEVEVIASGPQAANRGSWRALEKAGYSRVVDNVILDSDCPSDSGPAHIYARRRITT